MLSLFLSDAQEPPEELRRNARATRKRPDSFASVQFTNFLKCFQVRVGSLSDPKDTPGLAHFCEHMLFYASAKYPEEDAYSKFVVSSATSELL